jgi:hypothetical protein
MSLIGPGELICWNGTFAPAPAGIAIAAAAATPATATATLRRPPLDPMRSPFRRTMLHTPPPHLSLHRPVQQRKN